MGTRNLTMVINQEGEKKVAQYGQWDGYPSGVGAGILEFLNNKELFDKFKSNLSKVRFLEPEGRDKEFIENYEKLAPEWSNEPDLRTDEQKRWWSLYQSRDLANEVLENIANSEDEEIVLSDREPFAGDSLLCEWAYVIDLQKESFEVYEGFNKKPLTKEDRFFSLIKEGEEYLPVKKVTEYKLSDLPDIVDFISETEGSDEDE